MNDGVTVRSDIFEHNITDSVFLNKDSKMKEDFFIVDNTEYPEALFDTHWKGSSIPDDGSEDLYIEVAIITTYDSNEKYQTYVSFFTVMLIILLTLLVIAIMNYIY